MSKINIFLKIEFKNWQKKILKSQKKITEAKNWEKIFLSARKNFEAKNWEKKKCQKQEKRSWKLKTREKNS